MRECGDGGLKNGGTPATAGVASADVEQLVRLEAEAPAWMGETVVERRAHVALRVLGVAHVHRLEEEVREVERLEALRLRIRLTLRVDELQLVTAGEHERRVGLGTHADVIDAFGRGLRAVRLDGDLEAAGVQRPHGLRVELEEGLTAGAHDEWPAAR